MSNHMIDNMMGTLHRESVHDSELAGSTRKERGVFTDIIDKMHWESFKLKRIAEKDIPRAFPFSPPKGGSEPGYKHTQYEYCGAGFFAEIEDGLYAIEIVNEMFVILEGLQLIINSLFPNTINNGQWEIEIPDQFKKEKENIDEAVTLVKKYLSMLTTEIDQNPIPSIDINEMRNLQSHLTRLGFDFVKTGNVPQELMIREDERIRPDVLANERAYLESQQAMTPERMERLLLDSQPPASNDTPSITGSLTEHMLEQLNRKTSEKNRKILSDLNLASIPKDFSSYR